MMLFPPSVLILELEKDDSEKISRVGAFSLRSPNSEFTDEMVQPLTR